METSRKQANKLLLSSANYPRHGFSLQVLSQGHEPSQFSVKAQAARLHPIALLKVLKSSPFLAFFLPWQSPVLAQPKRTIGTWAGELWPVALSSPAALPVLGVSGRALCRGQQACPHRHRPRSPGSFPRHQSLISSVASSPTATGSVGWRLQA